MKTEAKNIKNKVCKRYNHRMKNNEYKLGLSWGKLSQSWIVFKLTEFCCDLNLIDIKSGNTSKIYLTKPLTYSLMIGLYWKKKLQLTGHHFRLAGI